MYSRISPAKNGYSAINYALGKGKGHNGNKHRNLRISTVNMADPSGRYAMQMNVYWKKVRKNHTVQIRRVIISFADDELSPDSEDDVVIAEQICREFVKKYYKDHQCLICLQADGKGHKLHGHLLINDVNIKTGKGCSSRQGSFKYVRKHIDEITKKYLDIKYGSKNKEKITQTERAKINKAEEIRSKNPGIPYDDLRKLLIKGKAYSFKDDMRSLVKDALKTASDKLQFLKNLEHHGISLIKIPNEKYGDYWVYDFNDCPIKTKHKPRVKAITLGEEFEPEQIDIYFKNEAASKKENNDTAKELTVPVPVKNDDHKENKGKFKPGFIATKNRDALQDALKSAEKVNKKIQKKTELDKRNRETIDSIELQYTKKTKQKDRSL